MSRPVPRCARPQEDAGDEEADSPLGEIEFWRARKVDMTGIRSQLDDPDLKTILEILDAAKSTYLAPFLDLQVRRRGSAPLLRYAYLPGACDGVLIHRIWPSVPCHGTRFALPPSLIMTING